MEGLIPFVLHALKKKRQRSKYISLSEGSSHSCRYPLTENVVGFSLEGSSHRRTMSEFQTPVSELEWGSSASDFGTWKMKRGSSQKQQQHQQQMKIEMRGRHNQKM